MPQVSIEQALRMAGEHVSHGRMAEGEAIYTQVVQVAPREGTAVYMLGVLAGNRRDWVAAERWLSQAVQLCPADPNVARDYAQVLMETGRVAEAVTSFERAATLAPGDWEVRFRLALALERRGGAGDLQRASDAYREVLRIDSARAEAHNNLGNLLQRQGGDAALNEAMEHFRKAAMRAGYVDPVGNLGSALAQGGRHEEAIACYRRAIEMCLPQDAGRMAIIWRNLGASLTALGRHAEAVAAFQEAIRRSPGYADAHSSLGIAYLAQYRLDGALEAFRTSQRLTPGNPDVLGNLGVVLAQMARLEEAIKCFREALRIDPRNAQTHSRLLGALHFWEGATAEMILAEAREWNLRHAVGVADGGHDYQRDPQRRLRIGYVSPDFREHCQAMFLVPLLANHDPGQVEVFAYSDVQRPDAMTARIRGHCHTWRDVSKLDDDQLARQIRQDYIDILVDLTMHMINNRLLVFAKKPAPVQFTWLAYPGTTGVAAIDYRITDPHLDPPGESDRDYTEGSIRLPETFWCYDALTTEIDVNDLPAKTNGYITFGCLNNFTKLNVRTLQRWAKVMEQVPGSRLMLLAPEGSCREWVQKTLAACGVSQDRLEFCGFAPRNAYVRQYHQIDIGLDTLPYNGHTTSLDSFWMGVPVVTLVGGTVVGRAGLSQLMNLGLPELVARTEESFVQTAVELAKDLPRLAELRGTLRQRMEKSALMDAGRFAAGIEAAYREAWRRWCASAPA